MTDIRRTDREMIRVEKRIFKGYEYIDIRVHFKDDRGKLCPSKKGITIHPDHAPEVIAAVAKELGIELEIGQGGRGE